MLFKSWNFEIHSKLCIEIMWILNLANYYFNIVINITIQYTVCNRQSSNVLLFLYHPKQKTKKLQIWAEKSWGTILIGHKRMYGDENVCITSS